MFNKKKFNLCVIASGLLMDDVARLLGITASTLYRKFNGKGEFTRAEIQRLQKILRLNAAEVSEIFFDS